jgi:hypothetical protein
MRKFLAQAAFTATVLAGTLAAQQVISLKAGLINLIQGDVKLNDEAIVVRNSRYAEMKNGDVVRTGEGRAEILLAPGSFIRLRENSSVRMESNALSNTRLALLDGDALLEVMELNKEASLEVLVGADKVSVQKPGLYRLDAANLNVKVVDGEVAVVSNDVLRKVGEGRMITLTGDRLIAKFDKKSGDEFSRWASRRSSYIAMANVSAAKDAYSYGYSMNSSGWVFNRWYGFYTYLPYGTNFYSPWGFNFFTPTTIYSYLYPPVAPSWGSGSNGWGGGSNSGFGMGSTPGGFDRGGMRGGGYGGGSYGGPSVGGGSVSGGAPSVGGGERASGGAAAGGARGGGAPAGGRGN